MAVKMYPTPTLHTGNKKFVQFKVTRQEHQPAYDKPAHTGGETPEPGRPRQRSKANMKKNPTRAEREERKAKTAALLARFRGGQPEKEETSEESGEE